MLPKHRIIRGQNLKKQFSNSVRRQWASRSEPLQLSKILEGGEDQKETALEDFPGGPVVKTLLPMQGANVQSLIKKLDPTHHTAWPKKNKTAQTRDNSVHELRIHWQIELVSVHSFAETFHNKILQVVLVVKNLTAKEEMQETWASSLCWEDPREKEMTTHSSILA